MEFSFCEFSFYLIHIVYAQYFRNVVYATRSNLMVGGNKFTALGQAIYRAHNRIDKDWDEVKKQMMLVVYHLQSGAQSFESLTM